MRKLAVSPRYSVPNIGGRTLARGAFVRGPNGNVENVFIGDGELTCKELERRALIQAEEDGVAGTEHDIQIIEGDING